MLVAGLQDSGSEEHRLVGDPGHEIGQENREGTCQSEVRAHTQGCLGGWGWEAEGRHTEEPGKEEGR